jgi:hypothetical protein
VLWAGQQVFLAELASRWSDRYRRLKRLATPSVVCSCSVVVAAVVSAAGAATAGPLQVEMPYFRRFKALLNSPANTAA